MVVNSNDKGGRLKENKMPARIRKKKGRSLRSRAKKKFYKDPVQRARAAINLQRTRAARKGPSRLGVPKGWTRGEAEMQRVYDGIKADLIMDQMKDKGMIDNTKPEDFEVIEVEFAGSIVKVRVPKTEAGMAEAALREAIIGAISPLTHVKDRVSYIRTVLEWTKKKPATDSNVNVSSEDWLEAALKDNDGDRAGEGSAS